MRRRYRLLGSLGLLVAGTFAVFAMLEVAPGGPAAVYLQNPGAGPTEIADVTHDLGAGRPFYVQYVAWLFRVLRGNLGWSTGNSEPVSTAIVERLPATLELAFVALVAAIVLGAAVGFARAHARAPVLRDVLAAMQLFGRAVPILVLALFLQLLSVLAIFHAPFGISSNDAFDLGDRLRHLILPVSCLALPFGAWVSLLFYDFFRVPENASPASLRSIAGLVAMTGAAVGPALLSASLFIEPMFAWPGVSRVFYNALTQFDVGVIAAFLLMYWGAIFLIELFAELSPGGVRDRAGPCRPDSPRTSATGRMRFSTIGVIGVTVLLGAIFGAILANLIAPIGPYYIDQVHWIGYPLAPGVAGHALGTDENGRDLLSRLLFGLRTSLGIAAFAALIASAIGFVIAKATTALRRLDDRIPLSVVGIRAFAGLPFVLAVVTVLVVRSNQGVHVLTPVVIALIIAAISWPAIVPAFRTLTSATLGAIIDLMACALLLEVTQSAIGFGVQPPTSSLGNMLVNALSNMTLAPWIPIAPTVAMVVVLFALYAVGGELRERSRLIAGTASAGAAPARN